MEALVLVLQDIRPSPSSYMSTHQSPLPEALDVLDLAADKLLELELSLGASDGLNPLRAAVLYKKSEAFYRTQLRTGDKLGDDVSIDL